MEQLLLIVSVAAMFLLRIGLPVILLLSIGILIDRWQSKRENDVQEEIHKTA